MNERLSGLNDKIGSEGYSRHCQIFYWLLYCRPKRIGNNSNNLYQNAFPNLSIIEIVTNVKLIYNRPMGRLLIEKIKELQMVLVQGICVQSRF